jgi:hypothetical protein
MPGGINAVWRYAPPTGWLDGGSTLLACALLQGMVSYPFHDPVLTDRAFLSRPRTMVAAFFVGGAIAGTFIVLFSAVGIFGCFLEGAVKNGSPAVMSKALSSAAFAFTNLVRLALPVHLSRQGRVLLSRHSSFSPKTRLPFLPTSFPAKPRRPFPPTTFPAGPRSPFPPGRVLISPPSRASPSPIQASSSAAPPPEPFHLRPERATMHPAP